MLLQIKKIGENMANYCWYQIHAKGNKKNINFLYHTMPVYDNIEILEIKERNEESTIVFRGSCKWSLDAYCEQSNRE